MLPSFLLLDLETTGSDPVRDRITEIAALRIDDGQVRARWQSLVDPGCPIPPFIQRLTGISDAMVADAPRFADVLGELLPLLDGAVLVAHNVRFDHAFLKNALAREGVERRMRTLCTVRLSRRLEPRASGHGLDALIRRHALPTTQRHRAMGDVLVLQAWLQRMAEVHGPQALRAHAQALLQGAASVPPQLQTDVDAIPDGPGVYLFHGDGALPLYIGKSVHLRRRVLSHFQADHSDPREMRISQQLRHIEVRPTAGAFGALLLEARLVKQLQPLYNRRLRRENRLCSWQLQADARQRPLLSLVRDEALQADAWPRLYGIYRSRRQAVQRLRELAEQHGLCQRVLGLESGRGNCFARQLGRCRGACCGMEGLEEHAQRVRQALHQERLLAWPYDGPVGLREVAADGLRSEVHVFDQWRHLGSARDDEELRQLLDRAHPSAALAFDLDTYRLLLDCLARQRAGGPQLLPLARPARLPAPVAGVD